MGFFQNVGQSIKKWASKTWEHSCDVLSLRPSFRLQDKQQAFQATYQQKWLDFQRESQARNGDIQQELEKKRQDFQREQQAKQQAFQGALQERNYQLMGELQREMALLKFEQDLFTQQAHFYQQEKTWEKNQFIQNEWPLISTPSGLVQRVQGFGSPLQIILSGSADGNFKGMLDHVANFFNTFYTEDSPVYYYNQGWKPNMANLTGNAQRDALHQALAGMPTLLLFPEVCDGRFSLNIAFWGWGEIKRPQTQNVFSVSIQALNSQILREMALEWKDRPFPPDPQGRMKTLQDNLAIVKKEDEYRQQLLETGMEQEEADRICNEAYASQYSRTGLEEDMIRRRNKLLSAPLEISASMIADSYNLPLGAAPRLPRLLQELDSKTRQEFIPLVGDFFDSFTEKLDILERPLALVLIARAFAASGDTERSEEYRTTALRLLSECYPKNCNAIAEKHWDAIEILRIDCPERRGTYLLSEQLQLKRTPPPVVEPAPVVDTPKTFSNSLGMQFKLIPAGTFTMGSPESEWNQAGITWKSYDEVQHEVTLSRDYYMGVYEVTQGEWERVMGENPSCFTGDRNPVECVSWEDCQEFVDKLNAQYKEELEQKLGAGWHYRLPSEAEWEYACRGGTTTPYSFGRRLNGDKANCDGNYPYGTDTEGTYLEQTSPVGSYAPNGYGLYDMHGNVWEWCSDYCEYDDGVITDTYRDGVTDPVCTTGSGRVCRGGSWSGGAALCRSAYRSYSAPASRLNDLGVRLSLSSR